MKISQRPPKGFTLIELLVVITIIGILAALAMPALSGALIKVNQTAVLNNAKQAYMGLKLYASDNDGLFPTKAPVATELNAAGAAATDSNAIFQNLVPRYLPNAKTLWVAKSAWCNPTAPADTPNTTDYTLNVTGGQNHFAYVRGLNETSNGSYPLIADGFSTAGATTGTYAENDGDPGGLWKGLNAVVVRVDGSGKVEKCNAAFQVFGPVGANGASANIFVNANNWLNASVVVLNPLPRVD